MKLHSGCQPERDSSGSGGPTSSFLLVVADKPVSPWLLASFFSFLLWQPLRRLLECPHSMAAALPKASELKERGPDGKLERFITQLISTVICHYRSDIPLVPETSLVCGRDHTGMWISQSADLGGPS